MMTGFIRTFVSSLVHVATIRSTPRLCFILIGTPTIALTNYLTTEGLITSHSS